MALSQLARGFGKRLSVCMLVSMCVCVPGRLVSSLICVGVCEECVYMSWVMIDFLSVSYYVWLRLSGMSVLCML